VLNDDVNTLEALSGITGYTPSNENYTTAKLVERKAAMDHAQGSETRQDALLKTVRDEATRIEWDFHNAILRAKEFVIAQYGNDSNEVQAVGLKKKSEYRAPHRSGTPEPAPAHAG
jgi:hypothetical protein